jgi:hypothetical protein
MRKFRPMVIFGTSRFGIGEVIFAGFSIALHSRSPGCLVPADTWDEVYCVQLKRVFLDSSFCVDVIEAGRAKPQEMPLPKSYERVRELGSYNGSALCPPLTLSTRSLSLYHLTQVMKYNWDLIVDSSTLF